MPKDDHSEGRNASCIEWRRAYWVTWTTMGWLLLGIGALWLLSRLWAVVLPLGVGLLIAFLLRPQVEWLADRGLPRWVAVTVSYLTALALLAAVIALLVPMVSAQADHLANAFPEYGSRVRSLIEGARTRYQGLQEPGWVLNVAEKILQGLQRRLVEFARGVAPRLLTFGGRAVGVIAGLITGVVISVYWLLAPPTAGSGDLPTIPPGWRDEVRAAGGRVEAAVGGFIRGQALVALAVGILTWIGLTIIGMPFAALLGVLAGALNVVPYLGPIVAGTLAAVVGLFESPMLAVSAVAVMAIVQQIDGALLTPRIMRGQVGLHPVVIILAIIAGQSLFGFVGLLLAIPVTAAVRALWEYYGERRGWRERTSQ
jgi:predicted PurR-regulated permease PerM